LPYELKILSFAAGDTRKPNSGAQSAASRAVLVEDDFVLYESSAIVEYLDEAYPGRGAHCSRRRQDAGDYPRMICEVDEDFDAALDPLTTQAFSKKPEERDAKAIADSRKALVDEMAQFSGAMRGDYLAGPLSAADYALYTLLALVWRSEIKLPDLGADSMLTPQLARWKARIEALPYFDKTIPPHWRKS
jgi:glutathione S-transferase